MTAQIDEKTLEAAEAAGIRKLEMSCVVPAGEKLTKAEAALLFNFRACLLAGIEAYEQAKIEAVSGDVVKRVAEWTPWQFGVIEFHSNEKLRNRFYHVVNDLRAAACIVDIWVNDIQRTLQEFGYRVDIYKPLHPAPKSPADE